MQHIGSIFQIFQARYPKYFNNIWIILLPSLFLTIDAQYRHANTFSRISSDRILHGGGTIFRYRLEEGGRVERRRKRHDIPRGISGMLDGGVTEGHVAALLVRFWPPFVTLTFASALRIARGNRARRCKTHSSGSSRLPCEILRQKPPLSAWNRGKIATAFLPDK